MLKCPPITSIPYCSWILQCYTYTRTAAATHARSNPGADRVRPSDTAHSDEEIQTAGARWIESAQSTAQLNALNAGKL